MKNDNKLNYSQKKANNPQKLKMFIISFAAFVVVLGTVSLLIFMKSLDFNIKNLVSSSDELTTEETTEESTQPISASGTSNIVVLCCNTEGELSFSFLVKTDYDNMKSDVVYIPTSISTMYDGNTSTITEHYKRSGADGFVKSFESYSGIAVDKYILVNETQFKTFVSKFKDITVTVPRKIDGAVADGLNLNKGKQNLTADLLLKYIKYIENKEKAKAFCNLLEVVFNKENEPKLDNLFAYLANNSQTNISIVDYTNQKNNIFAFIDVNGKYIPVEKLDDLINVEE